MLRRKYRKVYNFFNTYKRELRNGNTITCKIKYIGSFRFMSSSLSRFVDNLFEGLHNDKCTYCETSFENTTPFKKSINFQLLKIQ